MTWFFLTITAVFFITIESIFEKKTLAKARTFEFAAMFAFANALVLLPFLFVADLSQINFFILGAIFLASIPSAGLSLLVFKTLKHNELSETASLLALSPLFVSFFAFIVLGEMLSYMQFLGLLLMVGGMIFLELKNLKFSSGIFRKGRGKYIWYIIACLLLGGVSAVFDRTVLFRLGIKPLTYLLIIQIFIAINYALFFLSKPHLVRDLKGSVKETWKIVLFISGLTVAHRYMYASAIQVAASIGLVVAIYKLSSLSNVIAGGKFFAEGSILKKITVSMVVLSGTVLLVLE
ncbi:MAG: hypothetical protein COX30_03900 [Candidatus Moranbacteria bacterium CG23_combo_of_CG06-09_8_20_14_all_39_10]|nr:MAG: hypothetical protein COX30_03900 [Candidatus Moranbacteria bacterium CG23_combo_of_CG06-09_8_20_14_all_39_10]